jgi:hypothetical protein
VEAGRTPLIIVLPHDSVSESTFGLSQGTRSLPEDLLCPHLVLLSSCLLPSSHPWQACK